MRLLAPGSLRSPTPDDLGPCDPEPMPLYGADGSVSDPEWTVLDQRLRSGDGIHWSGDPRLWLGIGVLENRVTGKKGHRLEVWRDNEDGSTTMLGHWHPKDQFRVLYDLARMRVDSPRHENVLDVIDRHNEAKEKAESQKAFESLFDTLDHAIRLHHDRNNPRNRFSMNTPEAPKPAPKAA